MPDGRQLPAMPGLVTSAVQQIVTVVEQEQMARDTYRLRLHCPAIAEQIVPGQFFMIRVPSETDPLLGRPFALYDIYEERARPAGLDFGYLVVGKLTSRISYWKAGDVVEIRAAAYQQRGSRDFMKIAGQWLHNDSPYELPDRKGASDSITLTVYESPIELTIPRSGTPLDPQSGVLRIRRNPESVVSILIDRPDRPGFSLRTPDKAGRYVIRYLPDGKELNAFGKTEIEFTIRDVVGKPITVQLVIETP